MKIWIDADACPGPIKEIIYKAANRLKVETTLVANQYLKIPESPFLSMVCVEKGLDVADSYIISQVENHDLVVTADVPLASEVVKKGAVAIDPHGRIFDAHSIAEALSVRNFLQSLRESRVIEGGGPKPFNAVDKQKFAACFDREVAKLMKNTCNINKKAPI